MQVAALKRNASTFDSDDGSDDDEVRLLSRHIHEVALHSLQATQDPGQ